MLTAWGDHDAAERALRGALDVRRASYGPTHPNVAESLNALGVLRRYRNDLEGAEALCAEATRVQEAALGPHHPLLSPTLRNLAMIVEAQGRREECAVLMRRAMSIDERSLGADHERVLEARIVLARIQHRMQDTGGEIETLEPALAAARRGLAPDHHLLGNILFLLGSAYLDTGRPAEAEPLLAERAAMPLNRAPEALMIRERARTRHAECLLALGRYDEAEPIIRERIAATDAGSADTMKSELRAWLGHAAALCDATGRPEEAEACRRRLAAEPVVESPRPVPHK
jgi:tetratricopeptide (TPR) repeat protein